MATEEGTAQLRRVFPFGLLCMLGIGPCIDMVDQLRSLLKTYDSSVSDTGWSEIGISIIHQETKRRVEVRGMYHGICKAHLQ